MTDNELKELVAGLAVSQAKTDAQMARTEAQMAKTDATLERMGITLGGINNNFGYKTEDYFYNSMYDNPVLGGIKFDTIRKNIHTRTKRLEDEFDIVLYNGDSIGLIECKYKAHENDLNRLMTKKVDSFRQLFPDFQDYKIYLGLASFSFYPELEELAKLNGVAILKQKGDVVEIEAENLKVY
jgi:hypothetical protein